MDNLSPLIKQQLQKLQSFADTAGYVVGDQKIVQSGITVTVSDGTSRIPLNIFSTGKIQVQGKASDLRDILTAWKDGKTLSPVSPPATITTATSDIPPNSSPTSVTDKKIATKFIRIKLRHSGKTKFFKLRVLFRGRLSALLNFIGQSFAKGAIRSLLPNIKQEPCLYRDDKVYYFINYVMCWIVN